MHADHARQDFDYPGLRIEGEQGQNYRLESCRILREWTSRNAELSVTGGDYVFTTEKSDSREFFRIAQ